MGPHWWVRFCGPVCQSFEVLSRHAFLEPLQWSSKCADQFFIFVCAGLMAERVSPSLLHCLEICHACGEGCVLIHVSVLPVIFALACALCRQCRPKTDTLSKACIQVK